MKKGSHQSEEAKRKMFLSLKGKNKGKPTWNKGLTKETDERVRLWHEKTRKTRASNNFKLVLSEEEKRRRGQRFKEYNNNHSIEQEMIRREKISNAMRGKQKMYPSGRKENLNTVKKHYEKILEQVKNLESQGFRAIPIGKVIPDIIAFKDNKIYAVEVHNTGNPDYNKYVSIENYFDDIFWIFLYPLHKSKKSDMISYKNDSKLLSQYIKGIRKGEKRNEKM